MIFFIINACDPLLEISGVLCTQHTQSSIIVVERNIEEKLPHKTETEGVGPAFVRFDTDPPLLNSEVTDSALNTGLSADLSDTFVTSVDPASSVNQERPSTPSPCQENGMVDAFTCINPPLTHQAKVIPYSVQYNLISTLHLWLYTGRSQSIIEECAKVLDGYCDQAFEDMLAPIYDVKIRLLLVFVSVYGRLESKNPPNKTEFMGMFRDVLDVDRPEIVRTFIKQKGTSWKNIRFKMPANDTTHRVYFHAHSILYRLRAAGI